MSLSTMNNCRIPNFPGASMRFISVYIDMDCPSSSDDDKEPWWDKQKSELLRAEAAHFENLAIIWRAEEELMTFDYDEDDYYEYQCY